MGSCLYTFIVTIIAVALQIWLYNNIGICFAICMLGGAILYSLYNKEKWK